MPQSCPSDPPLVEGSVLALQQPWSGRGEDKRTGKDGHFFLFLQLE
jgi:hypothetical protein